MYLSPGVGSGGGMLALMSNSPVTYFFLKHTLESAESLLL